MSNNKYNFSSQGIFNGKTGKQLESTVFLRGVVVSNIDPTEANRVKVRIKGIDDHLKDSELTFAFPMLPKFFSITPKRGEVVFIFVPTTENPFLDRMYFGPLISQPQMLNRDSFVNGATAGLGTGFVQERPAPSTIPENKGVYVDKEDVGIQGRDNADIIFKSKEILLRAGKFDFDTKAGEIPKFNFTSPSYIQIKNDVVLNKNNNKGLIEKGGVINVVSSKINLLTHKNGSPRFILNNQDDMISQVELDKILAEAHPMVFGDLLLGYLKLLKNAFINHVHSYNGMNPEDLSGKNDIERYLQFDIESILSKNIKIN